MTTAKRAAQCALMAAVLLGAAGMRDSDRRKLPLVAYFAILGTAALSRLETL